MTPQQRAKEAISRWVATGGVPLSIHARMNLEGYIHQQIIEATNDEVAKRRAAEAALLTSPQVECDDFHTCIKVYNPIQKR